MLVPRLFHTQVGKEINHAGLSSLLLPRETKIYQVGRGGPVDRGKRRGLPAEGKLQSHPATVPDDMLVVSCIALEFQAEPEYNEGEEERDNLVLYVRYLMYSYCNNALYYLQNDPRGGKESLQKFEPQRGMGKRSDVQKARLPFIFLSPEGRGRPKRSYPHHQLSSRRFHIFTSQRRSRHRP